MKLADIKILTESSNLSALGVSKKNINKIHSEFTLNHDAEFTPLENKTAFKDAIKGNRLAVAVNDEGQAYAIAYWKSPSYGTMYKLVGPDYRITGSLTKMLREIKGRGFKFFSVEFKKDGKSLGKQYMSGYDGGASYDYGDPFVKKARKFDKAVKDHAAKAYQIIRNHLMDIIDDDETDGRTAGGYVPSNRDMNYIKGVMKAMKVMADKGIDGFFDGVGRTAQYGSRTAMKRFFSAAYDYYLDGAVERFERNENLAVHKFIKFIKAEIDNHVERVTTGGYEQNAKRAEDYKEENPNWKDYE